MHHQDGRMQAAGLDARAAYQRLTRKAQALAEEMEEVTSPHGVPTTGFDREDSMVVAVENVIGKRRRLKTG